MKPSEFVEKMAHEAEDKFSKDGHDIDSHVQMAVRIGAILDYLDSQWDIRRDPEHGGKDMGI